jgi:hypothetical protein
MWFSSSSAYYQILHIKWDEIQHMKYKYRYKYRWNTTHTTCVREIRSGQNILIERPEWKRPIGRESRKCEYIIKFNPKYIWFGGTMFWMLLWTSGFVEDSELIEKGKYMGFLRKILLWGDTENSRWRNVRNISEICEEVYIFTRNRPSIGSLLCCQCWNIMFCRKRLMVDILLRFRLC